MFFILPSFTRCHFYALVCSKNNPTSDEGCYSISDRHQRTLLHQARTTTLAVNMMKKKNESWRATATLPNNALFYNNSEVNGSPPAFERTSSAVLTSPKFQHIFFTLWKLWEWTHFYFYTLAREREKGMVSTCSKHYFTYFKQPLSHSERL